MAQAADFFVSYTSTDRAWAEWIAWQLEAEGYRVVVQAWDFGPGRDWTHEMQQATSTAKRALLVLSGAYLMSAHGEAEWRTFYAQDPSGERGLLLPVRVEEVEPPGLLRTRVYVDLVDHDAAAARAALLAAARGIRGKPAAEPQFPRNQQQPPSPTERPQYPADLPPAWNVPLHPNPFFTGRQLLLDELHARLTAPEADSRRMVLTGLGGVGKTQLAVEYAYRQRADYDLVWWMRGEQPASLLGDYAALARQLPLAADLEFAQDAPQEAARAAVRIWLEGHDRWLLLFDNVEDPLAIADLLPHGTAGHVLVTSRAESGWEHLAIPLAVEVLPATEAAGFLLARTEEHGPASEAAASDLASRLGGLPLALEQAGAYVASTGTVALAEYAELLAIQELEQPRSGESPGDQPTVTTTWSLALQRLQQTEPAAVLLLTLAAFLAPDDLPVPLLRAYRESLPDPLARAAGDPLTLGDAVAVLRRFSLVRVIADGLFVHRLLQAEVRAALSAKDERTWAAAAVRLLRVSIPEDSHEVGNWPDSERLLPHALVAAGHGQRLALKPESWLWLLAQAAGYLVERGQYQQALTLDEQILATHRRLLGDDHPDTLASMTSLAATLRAVGDLHGARELHEQALASFRRVLGDDHPSSLTSMSNLAETRMALGDLHGADELHRQALAGYQRILGHDHRSTLTSMSNLAGTRRALGDLHGARSLQEQALAGFRRIFGEDHPNTLTLMGNLALIRWDLGDLHGARTLQEEVLVGHRHLLGDDHPATLISMGNLAVTRQELGDLRGALGLHEQAVAGSRQVLGDDHPTTLSLIDNLALVRADLGDLHGARELHEKVLAGRRHLLGDDHPATLGAMSNLAATRRDLGDLAGARELNEQALAGRRLVLGDDHLDTLTSINNLAAARRDLGDLQGARELHEQAIASSRRVLGDDHPATLSAMSNFADTLLALGDLQGANELHQQAFTSRRQVLGDDHPDTLRSMHYLAETRRILGDLQGARRLLEQILAGRRRVLGDDHPDTLTSMRNLAAVRRELEAEV